MNPHPMVIPMANPVAQASPLSGALRPGLAALLCGAMAGLLAGCGGSSSPLPVAPTAAQCDFGLRYANGASSGIAINPEARTVPRQFTPCSLTQIQSGTLGICLQHPDIGELDAQLLGPDGTSLAIDLKAATRTGAACLDGGSLLNTTLPVAALPRLVSPQGQWSLVVKDLQPGYGSGSLVGWSLDLRGLQ